MMATRVRRFFVVFWAMTLITSTDLTGQQKIEAEVVFLRDSGFFPNTIQRKPGKFLLIVKNRSHASEISIGVASHSQQVLVAPTNAVASSHNFTLNLVAGDYAVTDANHPNWSQLTISIKP